MPVLHFMRVCAVVVFTLTALCTATLHGTEDSLKLEASRISATTTTKAFEEKSSYTLVRAEEWEGTAKSTADILAEQTGIQTRKYGGTGSFQTVSIRGINGKNVRVLLDGIPLNSAAGGAVDLSSVPAERLKEIEVYKGRVPPHLGGNSIGGAINLITRQEDHKNRARILAALGAYGHQKQSLETQLHPHKSFRVLASLSTEASDNNWEYLDRNNTPYNEDDDTLRTVENHAFQSRQFRLNPKWQFNESHALTAGFNWYESRIGIPAEEGRVNHTAFHHLENLDGLLRLVNTYEDPNQQFFITPQIGFLVREDLTWWSGLDQNMGTSHGGLKDAENSIGTSETEHRNVSGSVNLRYIPHSLWQTDATLESNYSDIKTQTKASGFPHGDWPGSALDATLAMETERIVATPKQRFSILAGGSGKILRNRSAGGRNEVFEIEVPEKDTLEWTWGAHGSLRYELWQQIAAFATLSRYNQIPGLQERYGTSGAVLPNPELKTETGTTIETGLKWQRSNLYGEFIWFRNHMYNGIVMHSDGYMTKPVNLGEAVVQGFETVFWFRLFETIRMDLRLTQQNTENRFRLNNYYGNELPNQPQYSGLAKLTLDILPNLTFQYWLDYKSAFYRDYANTQKIPGNGDSGLLFHNGLVRWEILRGLKTSLALQNFTQNDFIRSKDHYTAESGYSWILQPENQWLWTLEYSI